MAFSIESKLADLLQNDAAKAILDKHVPGMSSDPRLAMAKGMSLKTVAGFSQGQISAAALSAMDTELKGLG